MLIYLNMIFVFTEALLEVDVTCFVGVHHFIPPVVTIVKGLVIYWIKTYIFADHSWCIIELVF